MPRDARPAPMAPTRPAERLTAPPPSTDPLYAFQTAPGEGAIATVILDGEGTLGLLAKCFHSKKTLHTRPPGQLTLGKLIDGQGRMVDEAVAAPIDASESETKLEQVELSCHGGRGAAEAVAAALREAGFRAARPAELWARAHRAHKLPLIELEARLRYADARTARQAEFLLGHDSLLKKWERLGFEAALAARQGDDNWRALLAQAAADALAHAPAAQALLRTHRVLVAGPVNAGKSTLCNRLLRAEKSIVSDQPGTTRDRLERLASIQGLAVLLGDSAGFRPLHEGSGLDDEASVERAGQARALAAAEEADLVLLVIDATRAPTEVESEAAFQLATRPAVLVLNKSDQGVHEEAAGLGFALNVPSCEVSALRGEGVAALEGLIAQRLLQGEGPTPEAPFTARQQLCLENMAQDLKDELDAAAVLDHIRMFVGTRQNEAGLAVVFHDAPAFL